LLSRGETARFDARKKERMLTREQIAARVARELPDGASVSLDPTWAEEIKAKLPAGVRVKEPAEGEVEVAVVAPASITVAGEFAGDVRAAKTVFVIIAQHRSADGVSRVTKPDPSLPNKAQRVLSNLALFDVTPEGLVMREVAQGVSALEVQLESDSPLLASDELRLMNV
jgi:acyl CoA:acetate/3-ketoacid CoA transferase beta subunit